LDYLYPYIPVGILLILAVGFGAVNLALGRLIGPRSFNPSKLIPYESGIVPTGEASVRIPIKFYMVAILFLLFDIEAVFVLAWAVVFRGDHLKERIESGALNFTQQAFQRFAFFEMLVFVAILMVGFLYVWRKGGLRWS
jgi:NADH-quinone oxidoreductase subunit A